MSINLGFGVMVSYDWLENLLQVSRSVVKGTEGEIKRAGLHEFRRRNKITKILRL